MKFHYPAQRPQFSAAKSVIASCACALSIALSFAPSMATAQTSATPASERRYQVDVIVFLNKRRDRVDEEQPAKTEPIDDTNWLHYEDVAAGKHADLVPVPRENQGLATQWAALKRSTRYQPLLKASWVQPRWGEERSPSIRMRNGNRFSVTPARFDAEGIDYGFEGGYSFDDFFNEGSSEDAFTIDQLDGRVHVYIGRFVHFNSDLTLTEPLPDVRPSVTYTLADSATGTTTQSEVPITELTSSDVSTYRLQENRRMKVDEIHYFDHPNFGVIAQVRRYDEVQAELNEAANDANTPPTSSESSPPS